MDTEDTQAILDGRKTQFREAINLSSFIGGTAKELIETHSKHQVNDTLYIEGGDTVVGDIIVKIINVRVEELDDISIEDCYSEGIDPFDVLELLDGTESKEYEVFKGVWNKKAKKGYKYEDNPYVFVYDFEVVEDA